MINKALKTCLIIALVAFMPGASYSLPEIQEVVSGSADVEFTGSNTMSITATDNAIINYSSFNILEGESVFVNLPSSSSEILNRVIGGTQSNLLGNLNCNGLFILVNSSGIYVGQNANINVGSLILSTRDITNTDFLSGNYMFRKLSDQEVDMLLLNDGKINISEGGFGVLIAGAIENSGTIIAPIGKVALVSGDAVKLGISGDGLISVAIDEEVASAILDHEGNPITDQIKNSGIIEANGGAVILKAESLPDIFESVVNLDGVTRANTIQNINGSIFITASGAVKSTGTLETDILNEKGASFLVGGELLRRKRVG